MKCNKMKKLAVDIEAVRCGLNHQLNQRAGQGRQLQSGAETFSLHHLTNCIQIMEQHGTDLR